MALKQLILLVSIVSFIDLAPLLASDNQSSQPTQVNEAVLKTMQKRRDQLAAKSGKTVAENEELQKLEVEIKAKMGQ